MFIQTHTQSWQKAENIKYRKIYRMALAQRVLEMWSRQNDCRAVDTKMEPHSHYYYTVDGICDDYSWSLSFCLCRGCRIFFVYVLYLSGIRNIVQIGKVNENINSFAIANIFVDAMRSTFEQWNSSNLLN